MAYPVQIRPTDAARRPGEPRDPGGFRHFSFPSARVCCAPWSSAASSRCPSGFSSLAAPERAGDDGARAQGIAATRREPEPTWRELIEKGSNADLSRLNHPFAPQRPGVP